MALTSVISDAGRLSPSISVCGLWIAHPALNMAAGISDNFDINAGLLNSAGIKSLLPLFVKMQKRLVKKAV